MAVCEVRMSRGAFFGRDPSLGKVRDLLRGCAAKQGTLLLHLEGDAVVMSSGKPSGPPDVITVEGQWRTPDLRIAGDSAMSARLFLPFLFGLSAMALPWREVHATPHDFRPVADFFARNLLLAVARGTPVVCREKPVPPETMAAVKELQRQYFLAFKALFAEPLFQEHSAPDAIELMVAGAYAPGVTFDNVLLQGGLRELRKASANDLTGLRHNIAVARAAMMAQYA